MSNCSVLRAKLEELQTELAAAQENAERAGTDANEAIERERRRGDDAVSALGRLVEVAKVRCNHFTL